MLIYMSKLFPKSPVDKREYHKALLEGHSFELTKGDSLLAIGGAVQLFKGVAEVWMCVTPEGKAQPLSLSRSMKDMVSRLGAIFHRLQLTTLEHDTAAIRWAEFLGFTYEGLMIKYGPDQKNHKRFAKT